MANLTKTITSSNWTGKIRITYTASNGTLKIKEIEGTKTDSARSHDAQLTSVSVKIGSKTKTISLSHYIDFPAKGTWKAWGATDTSWTGITVTNPSISITLPTAPSGSSLSGAKFSSNLEMSFDSYKVTYNANGGSLGSVPSSQTKKHGTNISVPTAKPTKTGFTFQGWAVPGRGYDDAYYSPGETIEYNGNQELVAVWTENYVAINYYSNYATSGTFEGETLSVSSSKNIIAATKKYYYTTAYSGGLYNIQNSDLLYLSRTGHTPTGKWGTSTNGGTLIDQTVPFTSGQEIAEAFGKSLKTSNASVNVYAQWKPNTYTVT